MIDSWNAAKLNERINQVEQKIRANDVIANPTGAATSDLSKISIDGTVYGTSVVKANPAEEITADLTKVSVDGVVYEVSDPSLTVTSYSVPTTPSDYGVIQFKKSGNIVVVTINVLKNMTSSASTTVLNEELPEEYRPSSQVLCDLVTPFNEHLRMFIETNGTVQFYNYSTTTAEINLKSSFAYVV